MADGMVEWCLKGGTAEWREWQNGQNGGNGSNGSGNEWHKWLHTYYLQYTPTQHHQQQWHFNFLQYWWLSECLQMTSEFPWQDWKCVSSRHLQMDILCSIPQLLGDKQSPNWLYAGTDNSGTPETMCSVCLARGKDTFSHVGASMCIVCLARGKDTFSHAGATLCRERPCVGTHMMGKVLKAMNNRSP